MVFLFLVIANFEDLNILVLKNAHEISIPLIRPGFLLMLFWAFFTIVVIRGFIILLFLREKSEDFLLELGVLSATVPILIWCVLFFLKQLRWRLVIHLDDDTLICSYTLRKTKILVSDIKAIELNEVVFKPFSSNASVQELDFTVQKVFKNLRNMDFGFVLTVSTKNNRKYRFKRLDPSYEKELKSFLENNRIVDSEQSQ